MFLWACLVSNEIRAYSCINIKVCSYVTLGARPAEQSHIYKGRHTATLTPYQCTLHVMDKVSIRSGELSIIGWLAHLYFPLMYLFFSFINASKLFLDILLLMSYHNCVKHAISSSIKIMYYCHSSLATKQYSHEKSFKVYDFVMCFYCPSQSQ